MGRTLEETNFGFVQGDELRRSLGKLTERRCVDLSDYPHLDLFIFFHFLTL
uniref:Uncharacterized protein n=1 Tax=Meloidogyne enterolobii TaxID=390850 RepID=A0A6V7WMK2_MELEN|nr:unnamed protein product [Meloidogyne enterolobii]